MSTFRAFIGEDAVLTLIRIVSQCNPHVHLFFFAARGAVGRPVAHRHGKGWRGGFILSALEKYVK